MRRWSRFFVVGMFLWCQLPGLFAQGVNPVARANTDNLYTPWLSKSDAVLREIHQGILAVKDRYPQLKNYNDRAFRAGHSGVEQHCKGAGKLRRCQVVPVGYTGRIHYAYGGYALDLDFGLDFGSERTVKAGLVRDGAVSEVFSLPDMKIFLWVRTTPQEKMDGELTELIRVVMKKYNKNYLHYPRLLFKAYRELGLGELKTAREDLNACAKAYDHTAAPYFLELLDQCDNAALIVGVKSDLGFYTIDSRKIKRQFRQALNFSLHGVPFPQDITNSGLGEDIILDDSVKKRISYEEIKKMAAGLAKKDLAVIIEDVVGDRSGVMMVAANTMRLAIDLRAAGFKRVMVHRYPLRGVADVQAKDVSR